MESQVIKILTVIASSFGSIRFPSEPIGKFVFILVIDSNISAFLALLLNSIIILLKGYRPTDIKSSKSCGWYDLVSLDPLK